MPQTYASVSQFGLWGLESTPGTTPASYFGLLYDQFQWEDKIVYLEDKAFRGVMMNDAFNEIQGVKYCDLSMGGPVYMDSIGMPLANILGEGLFTTGTPNTWAFNLLNPTNATTAPYSGQPATHGLVQWYGPTTTTGARLFPSACFSSLELDFNAANGLLMWTGKANSFASVPVPTTRPTFVTSTEVPVAAWSGSLSLGGSGDVTLSEGKVTLTRELENVFTVDGSQNPYIIQRGGLSATFDLTFVAASEAELLYYLNNTQPTLSLTFTNNLAAGALRSINIAAQQAAFLTAKPDFGNKEVRFQTTGKFIGNTTNVGASGGYGPLTATLRNNVATGVYTPYN